MRDERKRACSRGGNDKQAVLCHQTTIRPQELGERRSVMPINTELQMRNERDEGTPTE